MYCIGAQMQNMTFLAASGKLHIFCCIIKPKQMEKKKSIRGVEGGHLFSLIGRIICFGTEGSFPWEQFVAVFLLHFGSLLATRLATHPLIKCGSEKRESLIFYIDFVIFCDFFPLPPSGGGEGGGWHSCNEQNTIHKIEKNSLTKLYLKRYLA